MATRPSVLLTASAVVYLAAALPLLFASEELLRLAGVTVTPLDVGVLQVLSGALFGFFMLNWMNRHSRVGGIFGRPVLLANFMHTAIASAMLGHLLQHGQGGAWTWSILAVYAVLAVAFGAKLFLKGA